MNISTEKDKLICKKFKFTPDMFNNYDYGIVGYGKRHDSGGPLDYYFDFRLQSAGLYGPLLPQNIKIHFIEFKPKYIFAIKNQETNKTTPVPFEWIYDIYHEGGMPQPVYVTINLNTFGPNDIEESSLVTLPLRTTDSVFEVRDLLYFDLTVFYSKLK